MMDGSAEASARVKHKFRYRSAKTGEAREASCKASHIGLRDGAIPATRFRLLPHGFGFILVWSDAFSRGLAGFVLLVFGFPRLSLLRLLEATRTPLF